MQPEIKAIDFMWQWIHDMESITPKETPSCSILRMMCLSVNINWGLTTGPYSI